MGPSDNDPLHGITLEALLLELVALHGWPELASRVRIRCFSHEPSVPSSLKFLRRTPWARAAVERLYIEARGQQKRKQKRNQERAARRAYAAARATAEGEVAEGEKFGPAVEAAADVDVVDATEVAAAAEVAAPAGVDVEVKIEADGYARTTATTGSPLR